MQVFLQLVAEYKATTPRREYFKIISIFQEEDTEGSDSPPSTCWANSDQFQPLPCRMCHLFLAFWFIQ